MIIKEKEIKTYVYELEDDFYVNVAESILGDEWFDFYLSHKSYSIKDFMFACHKDGEENIKNLILENAKEHIEEYKENYFNEEDL